MAKLTPVGPLGLNMGIALLIAGAAGPARSEFFCAGLFVASPDAALYMIVRRSIHHALGQYQFSEGAQLRQKFLFGNCLSALLWHLLADWTLMNLTVTCFQCSCYHNLHCHSRRNGLF
jgi:hypothetical protein